MKKKMISLALALLMVLSLLPVTAFAAATYVASEINEYDVLAAGDTVTSDEKWTYYFAHSETTGTIRNSFPLILPADFDYYLVTMNEPDGAGLVLVGLYPLTIQAPEGTTVSGVGSFYEPAIFNPNGTYYLNGGGWFVVTPPAGQEVKTVTLNGKENALWYASNINAYQIIEDNANLSATSANTLVITTEVPHVHAVDSGKHHEAIAPTCENDGTLEYWECSDPTCNAYLDKDGKELASIAGDPATGHDFSGDAVSNGSGAHSFKCVNGTCEAVGFNGVENATEPCADANHDHKCDECEYVMSACADDNNDHKCDVCGKVLSECEDDGTGHCKICGKELSVPATPTKPACNPIKIIAETTVRIVAAVKAVSVIKTVTVIKAIGRLFR